MNTATAIADTQINNPMTLSFQDLMTRKLAGVENTEVVMSITTVPPNTKLPTHWHPGEELESNILERCYPEYFWLK